MIKDPYYKSWGSLFWIRQSDEEKVHLPDVQMDLFWRGSDRTEITITGNIPNAMNLFDFREGDSLCVLYKYYGAPDEFNRDQIILLVAGCHVANFRIKGFVDPQSDDKISFELRVIGTTIMNKFSND